MKEKHGRAIGAALLAAIGAFIAAGGNEPQTAWDWAQMTAGMATAGLTAYLAFLSKHSGLNP